MSTFTNVECRLLQSLAVEVKDFSLEETLASGLRLSSYTVNQGLLSLEAKDLVRRPVLASEPQQTWWRLTNRGLTKRERVSQAKAMLAREG